jgi:hypothetical protein
MKKPLVYAKRFLKRLDSLNAVPMLSEERWKRPVLSLTLLTVARSKPSTNCVSLVCLSMT